MTNIKFPIYSIGHGSRDIESFFGLLKKYEIDFLIDVRTNPFSRFNPHFSRGYIENLCKNYMVTYVFMGDGLGGKPANRLCYDEQGHVVYEKVMETEIFIQSANRLITAYDKNLRVACMCSELKPCECHRSKMIGRYLERKNIDVQHIDEKGDLISQKQVINQISKGYGDKDLFGYLTGATSLGTYK